MRAINTLSFPNADDPAGIDLAHIDAFTIGPITATPYELIIANRDDSVHLEPKVMKVLVALSLEPGRVLSRDDLIKMVWDGRIVGDASINRVVSHLRAALQNLAKGDVEVETLPRVGYRLKLGDETQFESVADIEALSQSIRQKWLLVSALLIGAILALALVFSPRHEQVDSIHIVMLPIKAASPADEFTAIGLSMELREELAASEGLHVISSSSAEQLLEQGRSPREIAQAFDADFLVTGEFSTKSGTSSLVISMYTRAGDNPIWGRQLANESKLGPLILTRATREIRATAGLAPEGEVTEMPLARQEYQQFILARGIVRSQGRNSMQVAEQILEGLLEKHPDFVPAIVSLASAQRWLPYPPGGDPKELARRWKRSGELLDRALELEPDNAQALGLKGFFSDGEVEDRLQMLNRSLELDPGNRNIMQMQAVLSLATGRAEEALKTYDAIIDFDPLWLRAPQGHDMAMELGRLELAREMMRRLRTIVTDNNQVLLLDAAEARAAGDLSLAYDLLSQLDHNASQGQRSTAHFYKTAIEQHLDIVEEMGDERRNLAQPDQFLLRGNLPGKAGLEALGMTTQQFWGNEFFREYAPRMLVADGRSEDLVAYYDEFAGSPEKLLEEISNGSFDYRTVAPYLALALREVGRTEEAAQVLGLARRIDEQFVSHGQQSMAELIRSAQLYAVTGREDLALANLLKARKMGWPYISCWLLAYPYAGNLADDPAFATLLGEPRFISLANSVETDRQAERREILAMRFN